MAEMRLIVAGAGGRMGRTLVKAITEAKGFTLAGALEDARSPLIGWDAGTLAGTPENGVKLSGDAAALIDKADGIIDFTAPVATAAFAALAAKHGKVHVIGTTGLSAADEGKIKEAAKQAVIVKSGNMSLGVNLLAALTQRVAKTLDPTFDIEILEMHHNQKKDAPSGTALLLGRAAAQGRGIDFDRHKVMSR
ncbi:MAG: 4-hydroxy-tetrahydrodipicolinate reductase, partial [Pseudolabrys sp.]